MKETKLHHQRKFPALSLVIPKILCNFTSLKNTLRKMAKTKEFIRRLIIGIVPPYYCCNGSNDHVLKGGFSNGTGNALFMFAEVKSQPFNGFIV